MLPQPKFRWFQCSVNCDNSDKNFRNPEGYIENGDVYEIIPEIRNKSNVNYKFFGREYNESVWFSDISFLITLARKGILQLENADSSYKITDYSEIRRFICELFLGIRNLLNNSNRLNSDHFNAIKVNLIPLVKLILSNHVTRLKLMPDYVLFNSVERIENLSHHATYNYLHLSLDMFWLLSLSLEHNLEDESRLEVFERNLFELLSDLIYVADKIFERSNNFDLLKLSPFICSCFKELWLLIQLYVEKLHRQHFCKDFWIYYNKASNEFFNCNNNGKQTVKCIWLLYHVSRLQGYDKNGIFVGSNNLRVVSNYTLIEQNLKHITQTNLDESLMISCLNLIAQFQMNWWKKDASFNLLQVLWEYFYKRINNSFNLDNITNLNKTVDYSILTDNILKHDLSNSSYEIFLSILGKYLKENPLHWPKLKGRIYSKLPAQKLALFTENGLHNLVQLFFVLAYSVNFSELTDKLQSLLSQLPETNSESSGVVWNTYVSLLLMRAQRGITLNTSEMCTPILLAIQSASSDRSKAHLMRIFVEGVQKLIDVDSCLQCHEYTLFDSWCHRYLQWCSYSDACNLLEILKNVVEKVNHVGEGHQWWPVMETHIIPSIKQFSVVTDSPIQVAELAATLISADLPRFQALLKHMTGDTVHIPQSVKFLTAFLELNRSTLNELKEHQAILIQAWIRIALLNTDKSELTELTQLMTHLPDWTQTIGSFDIETEDPLFAVIRLAGYRIRDAATVMDNFALKKWFETYFGRMDRWIVPVLAGAERGDNVQLVFRVFTCASLLVYHCATALYIKNKNTCLLYRLISTLLLPSSVLMNKKPINIILTALRRTWHLFVRGIGRLDFKQDTYIERTLKDMVIRYVPHMYDSQSPILRCVDKDFENTTSSFIFEKIAITFLPCKSKTTNEFSSQALKLILEMCKTCSDPNKMKSFVETFLPYLFEIVIFVEDTSMKNNVYQILQYVVSNQNYSQLEDAMHTSLINVISKHLSFYSTNVFKFIEFVIVLIPNEIENIIPNLKEVIIKVEGMRGVGNDNTLRKGLQRIEDIITQHSK